MRGGGACEPSAVSFNLGPTLLQKVAEMDLHWGPSHLPVLQDRGVGHERHEGGLAFFQPDAVAVARQRCEVVSVGLADRQDKQGSKGDEFHRAPSKRHLQLEGKTLWFWKPSRTKKDQDLPKEMGPPCPPSQVSHRGGRSAVTALFFRLVDLVRIEGSLPDEVETSWITGCNGPVEAGTSAGVTGACSLLVDIHDQRVLVTIGTNLKHRLGMARSGALVPELLSTTGVVDGLADLQGLKQGLLVHPGQHEGLSGLGIDGQCRDESVCVEFRAKLARCIHRALVGAGGEADFCSLPGWVLFAHRWMLVAKEAKRKG